MRRIATLSCIAASMLLLTLVFTPELPALDVDRADVESSKRRAPAGEIGTGSRSTVPGHDEQATSAVQSDCSTALTIPTALTAIFIDGFESGGMEAWSETNPSKQEALSSRGDETMSEVSHDS